MIAVVVVHKTSCGKLQMVLLPASLPPSPAATYPIDLTRTRLQIQKHQLGSAHYRGAIQTVTGVSKEHSVENVISLTHQPYPFVYCYCIIAVTGKGRGWSARLEFATVHAQVSTCVCVHC